MSREYELYRVIEDYEALQDGFLDRIDDLNTTLEQIDLAGGLAKGNAQKLLTKNPGKMRSDKPNTVSRRTFGWETLGKMLKGTGLALVLVVDDERFAETKEMLVQRRKPRQSGPISDAVIKRKISDIFAENGRKGGLKRHANIDPTYASKIARKAVKSRHRKLTRKERQALAKRLAEIRWARHRKEQIEILQAVNPRWAGAIVLDKEA